MGESLRNTYMRAALGTLSYVKSKMDIGASDQFPQSMWGWVARQECVPKVNELVLKDLKQQAPLLHSAEARKKAMVDSWAYWGTQMGCGNCGVQSAMAFVRLRDYWKIFPLDWVQLKHGDHGFVVIGRVAEPKRLFPILWNREAVICDPWHGRAEEADTSVMCGKEVEVLYRLEA